MSLLEMVTQTMQSGGIEQISSRLGIKEDQVSSVVAGALPMLVGALSKNSANPGGASALAGALDRDHDGSILDDLAGMIGGGHAEKQGAGILGHVFGSRQQPVESALSTMSGLDRGSVGQILMMVAPVVLGALGKMKRQKQLDASGLSELIQGEQETAKQKAPDAMGLLGSLLDSDGDGEVADDLVKIGGSLLGSLFGKR